MGGLVGAGGAAEPSRLWPAADWPAGRVRSSPRSELTPQPAWHTCGRQGARQGQTPAVDPGGYPHFVSSILRLPPGVKGVEWVRRPGPGQQVGAAGWILSPRLGHPRSFQSPNSLWTLQGEGREQESLPGLAWPLGHLRVLWTGQTLEALVYSLPFLAPALGFFVCLWFLF